MTSLELRNSRSPMDNETRTWRHCHVVMHCVGRALQNYTLSAVSNDLKGSCLRGQAESVPHPKQFWISYRLRLSGSIIYWEFSSSLPITYFSLICSIIICSMCRVGTVKTSVETVAVFQLSYKRNNKQLYWNVSLRPRIAEERWRILYKDSRRRPPRVELPPSQPPTPPPPSQDSPTPLPQFHTGGKFWGKYTNYTSISQDR